MYSYPFNNIKGLLNSYRSSDSIVNSLVLVAAGTLASTALTLVFNLYAGNILSPEEYGKFNVVQSMSLFIYIPMLLGLNTSLVKYLSEKSDSDRMAIISTTYVLVFTFTVISVAIYIISFNVVVRYLSLSRELFLLSVLFAACFVFYTITTYTLMGLLKLKLLSVYQLLYSLLILAILLLILFTFHINDYTLMVYPIILAYGITGSLIFLKYILPFTCFIFHKGYAIILLRYGFYALVGQTTYSIYTNIDKILIYKFLSGADLGLYAAYAFSSISIGLILINIINIVLFPNVSRSSNKKMIYDRVNSLLPLLMVISFLFIFSVESLLLKFFWARYAFDLTLIILFAMASILIVANGIYTWLLNATGIMGIKITSLNSILIAIASFSLNIALIPLIGIHGAVLSLIICYLLSILYMRVKCTRVFSTVDL